MNPVFDVSVAVTTGSFIVLGCDVCDQLVDGTPHIRNHFRYLALCSPPKARHQLGKLHSSTCVQVSFNMAASEGIIFYVCVPTFTYSREKYDNCYMFFRFLLPSDGAKGDKFLLSLG